MRHFGNDIKNIIPYLIIFIIVALEKFNPKRLQMVSYKNGAFNYQIE